MQSRERGGTSDYLRVQSKPGREGRSFRLPSCTEQAWEEGRGFRLPACHMHKASLGGGGVSYNYLHAQSKPGGAGLQTTYMCLTFSLGILIELKGS